MGAWFQPQHVFGTLVLMAAGMVAVFVEAAPLGLQADSRPSPDLVFCLVAYWSLRRPVSAALLAVFALGLVRDLLTDVPVGLGALTLVAASEYLRKLGPFLSRRSFVTEWVVVAGFLGVTLALQWAVVLLLLAHPPFLSDLLLQWAITMALYPAMVAVLRWLFRIGWPRPEPART